MDVVVVESDGAESTPLWWAAVAAHAGAAGGAELATLLAERGADVNAFGIHKAYGVRKESTPLWWAARAVHDGAAGGAWRILRATS